MIGLVRCGECLIPSIRTQFVVGLLCGRTGFDSLFGMIHNSLFFFFFVEMPSPFLLETLGVACN